MAVRRVKIVNRAAKPHECSRCRAVISKGDSYRYWLVGFRPSYKRIRCMRSECTPRTSELETSNVAEAYAAIESAEDTLNGLGEPGWGDWDSAVSAVRDAVTEAGDAIEEVGQTYREADEAFGGQGATEHAERADTLEQAASELQGYDPSEDEPQACAEHDEPEEGCTDCYDNVSAWFSSMVQEAHDALSVDLP